MSKFILCTSYEGGKKPVFFSSCPFCGRAMEFLEEQTITVKNCPACGSPIKFEEIFDEKRKYLIVADVQGRTFTKDGFIVENGTLVKYEGTESEVVLPSEIIMIGEDAFKDNLKLKEVVCSKGIVSIGRYAFFGCVNLRKVHLPETLVTIGHYAFSGCRRLEKVEIPPSLRCCGYAIFQDCENLVEADLPMDMSFVAGSLYYNCRRLMRANIPHCVLDITRWFIDCENLEIVTFGRSVQKIQFIKFPKLKEAYFFETEDWKSFGADFPAKKLKNPKQAAGVVKKYAFEKKPLYLSKGWLKYTQYFLKLYETEN